MIIAAPQLNGWDEDSADETIVLVEYLLSAYNIDKSKVYIEGYSGGGRNCIASSWQEIRFIYGIFARSALNGTENTKALQKQNYPFTLQSEEMTNTTARKNLKMPTIHFIISTKSKA